MGLFSKRSARVTVPEAHFSFDVYSLGALLELTPAQFEQAVCELLMAMGYRAVERTGGSGDLGADIVCRDTVGDLVIVQCKRYAPGTRVGSPVMQTFIGMMAAHHRAGKGIFVTTGGFKPEATELAAQHRVTLLDGSALVDLFRQPRFAITGEPSPTKMILLAPLTNGRLLVFSDRIELHRNGIQETFALAGASAVIRTHFFKPTGLDLTFADGTARSIVLLDDQRYREVQREIAAARRGAGRVRP